MLHFMRRFANSLGGKILGVALVIALGAFGVPSILATLDANTITRVGDEDITAADFQRLYQQNLNAFAQQTGQLPTNEQAIQFGIPTSVLNQLTTRAAINQFAIRNGIGVSDAKLAELVRQDPTFFGVLGSFDRSIYDQTLRQQGLTSEQYFETQRKAARRQQIAIGLFAGSQISKTGLDLLNRYRNDLRTVEYFTLNSTSLPEIPVPTDEDLTTYLTANQANYRTLETRTADVLVLTLETLSALPDYQPAEDEVRAEYERVKDSLTKLEKRTIKQVSLPDAAAEKVFTDAQAAGTGFDAALAASGLTATDIGTLAKSQVSDTALADAAFALPAAGSFTIIAGIGGKRVVAVTAIEAGGTIAYEEAKGDIAKRLATDKARAAYVDIQDQIEELRAAFQPLKQISERYGLPVTTVALTASGAELSVVPGLAEADRAKAAQAIFAAEVGKLSATITYNANNNLWFDLNNIEVARDQTLDEVRDAVTTAWTTAKTDELLKAEIDEIVAALDSGTPFQDVATERGQFATISAPMTRDGDNTPVFNQAVATSIFSSGPDTHGWAVNGDGDYLVYHVTDVTPPTTAPGQDITDFLTNATRDGLYADLITGLTDEMWPPNARGGAYQRMLTLLTTTTAQ
ncbi:MAG: peptidylprolyl isomerase [Devosia sp.]|uniref:peptidylprolyl isomerase n=1 Tax=Devosia sp. TaxID=1871048 RepID=UPI001A4044A7|nr:peptidylprolyl isomerase [Devosia sp.]MBL8596122.1 peptidylprolyl isomerase [Devosia sp.]